MYVRRITNAYHLHVGERQSTRHQGLSHCYYEDLQMRLRVKEPQSRVESARSNPLPDGQGLTTPLAMRGLHSPIIYICLEFVSKELELEMQSQQRESKTWGQADEEEEESGRESRYGVGDICAYFIKRVLIPSCTYDRS